MPMHARLNESDQVVEFRDLPERPPAVVHSVIDVVDGERVRSRVEVPPADPDHPYDIPHKGVRWRRVVEDPEPGHDPETQDTATDYVLEGDVVRRVWRVHPKPAEVVAEVIRARYRNRIVDALPDMARVAEICAERDKSLAAAHAEG